ncbi:MAG: substrate-binding domain-containing protein, partial [Propionibacteriaceae bacterium]|nr:substrate-binding domain-containing protein [Propionibacteriaceae bacterium]
MKRPYWNLLIGLAVIGLITAGCSQTPAQTSPAPEGGEAGQIKIGYVVKRGTDPFAADQVDAAKARAEKEGVELLTADVKQDSGLTISTVQQMIANGIQGLIIVVPDQALGPQIMQLAADAGIPVLASDDPIVDSEGVAAPFVGLDGAELGTQAGEELLKLAQAQPEITPETAALAIVSQNSISACLERTDNAIKAFNEGGGDALAQTLDVPHDGTLQTAVTSMSATITQNADVKHWFITSCNDDGVAGALRALEAVGVGTSNSWGIGMDGALACTELAKDNAFVGANYVSFRVNGEIAFDSMLAYLRDGTPLPEHQSVPGPL